MAFERIEKIPMVLMTFGSCSPGNMLQCAMLRVVSLVGFPLRRLEVFLCPVFPGHLRMCLKSLKSPCKTVFTCTLAHYEVFLQMPKPRKTNPELPFGDG
jgi:hypothetical protein